MRIDIREAAQDQEVLDMDFFFRMHLPGFAVLVDGYHAPACVALDTKEGWVERYQMDEKGSLVYGDDGMAILTKTTGHVTIMLPKALEGEDHMSGFDREAKREIDVINPQPEFYRG